MTKEEIRNAVMNAAKKYGYDLIMYDFEHIEDKDEFLMRMERDFNHFYGGENFQDVFDCIQVDDDTNLYDVMNEGDVFFEENVYEWCTLGRIDAWKELLHRNPLKIDNIYVVNADYNRPINGSHTTVTDDFEEVEQVVNQYVWTYSDATVEVFKNEQLIKHLNIKNK